MVRRAIPFPVITTERLYLRSLKPDDAVSIQALRSNPQVNQFLDRPGLVSIEDARIFIEKIKSNFSNNLGVYWAITLKDSEDVVGTICIWNINVEKEMAEMGYELLPQFQGKGIMQEAISKIIDFCFDELGLKVITAFTHLENTKSIDLLVRNNFKLDTDFLLVSKEEADGLAVYYLFKKYK